jgi:hypothetical protein
MGSEALIIPDKENDALENANPVTAENGILNLYRGASCKPVSQKQQDILLASVDPNDIEIKPDGSPYYPQVKYRRRLNRAFGPMGWALLPANELSMKGNTLYRKYVLIVGDRHVSEAIGSQKYYENNENMDYADAAEGVKSNSLERCCKDLGIASELWDPNWIHQWREQYAIEVKAPSKGQMKDMWRRKDRPAFKGEGGQIPQPQTVTNSAQQSAPRAPANEHIISDPQRKRMYAISKNAGLSDDQFKTLLSSCGYGSSSNVQTKHYNKICEAIEMTTQESFSLTVDFLQKWCKEN